MKYEYLRIYENLNLLCRNCQKPFLAVEAFAIPVAVNGLNASCYPWLFAQMESPNNQSGGVGLDAGGLANELRMDGFPNLNTMWGDAFPRSNTAATASAAEAVNLSSEDKLDSEDTQSNETYVALAFVLETPMIIPDILSSFEIKSVPREPEIAGSRD